MVDLDFFFLDISFEYFLSFILDYVKNNTDLPRGWEIGSVAFLSFVDRDTHPTYTRCRGIFAPVTGFVPFVLFGRRLSGNLCVEEYLHCVRRLLALQALFLLRRLLPLAETSSGVSLPGTSSSSSSLPLGRQEGSQGAPGVLSRGASSPPARSRSSGRGGGASGLLSGARGRAPSSPSPSPSGAGEVGGARSL